MGFSEYEQESLIDAWKPRYFNEASFPVDATEQKKTDKIIHIAYIDRTN